MARTIDQIFSDLIARKEQTPELDGLTSTSKTAIWRLWLYIVSFGIWTLETLFDTHKTEVTNILTQLKPHTMRWYRNKALAFQYGFELYDDSDVYNNESYTDEQVNNSKIIKYSAVTESVSESRLIIKIATEANSELQPITDAQKSAFESYIEEIKDAGVKVTIINYLPDILQLSLKIYYDPLLLTSDGTSILTGKKPVEDALKEFMKELPFNGELILASLIDKLQAVEGVKIPHLTYAASKWIDTTGQAYGNYENIVVKKIPVSGYFKIENYTNIEYVV